MMSKTLIIASVAAVALTACNKKEEVAPPATPPSTSAPSAPAPNPALPPASSSSPATPGNSTTTPAP